MSLGVRTSLSWTSPRQYLTVRFRCPESIASHSDMQGHWSSIRYWQVTGGGTPKLSSYKSMFVRFVVISHLRWFKISCWNTCHKPTEIGIPNISRSATVQHRHWPTQRAPQMLQTVGKQQSHIGDADKNAVFTRFDHVR